MLFREAKIVVGGMTTQVAEGAILNPDAIPNAATLAQQLNSQCITI